MSTLSTTHIRNLLNFFNSIIDQRDPLGIFQGQIEQFERNFTTPTQPLYLYIDLPKEDPPTPFTKSTFTLASPHPLTPPGLLLEVYCPCIYMGSSGVVLPRGIEFSASTSSIPPTRRVSFPVQAKECKGMDEKECKNNPDICTYRSFRGGKRRCAARWGTLKPGASKLLRRLLDEFKPRVLEYLPDLIGTIPRRCTHVLPQDHVDLTPYTHLEVVKRFTITEDTNFSRSLVSIVGGGVRLVGNMIDKFCNLTLFNSPVDRWDVSQVTHMSQMFHGAIAFNQPLEIWNVSGVTDMYGMFQITEAFNQPLEGWNVSQVTRMSQLFNRATAFNQPLEQWNVSGVTNMSRMFCRASIFNQPLEQWNVSGVTNTRGMFSGATSFNQPLGGWNTSMVEIMDHMFEGATTFNQPIGQWDVSGVKFIYTMFKGTTAFNQPLGQWNVSRVNDMYGMFQYATTFNQPLEQWNVSGVKSMIDMFLGATTFNQPLEGWNVNRDTNHDDMFDGSGMDSLPSWYSL